MQVGHGADLYHPGLRDFKHLRAAFAAWLVQ
jgi:hypothetical protein